MWSRLFPREALNEIVPADPVLMHLKRRPAGRKPIPYPVVSNPRAREWALWEPGALMREDTVHWIIDNRQVSNGDSACGAMTRT
jgi:hypothetical protein